MHENHSYLLGVVAATYDYKFSQHGPTHEGVMWENDDTQKLRFEILATMLASERRDHPFSVNDLGCGYGALFTFLTDHQLMNVGAYYGYDISDKMIASAKQKLSDSNAHFLVSNTATNFADYSFVSGTFALKAAAQNQEWNLYIKSSLRLLWRQSGSGMAFNLPDRAKVAEPDNWFYYANSKEFLDFCCSEFTPKAELIACDKLPDFTIVARKF